jgi:GINS complex subunit 3
MAHLDVNLLLSLEDRVPCVFKLEVPALGFLDPSNDQSHLPAGARVELPLWMAHSLMQRKMVTMELPKHFDKKMRENIAAGALNLNLREYSNYYFEVGMQIATALDDNDLKDTLRIAFTGDRYREVMVNALTR